MRMNIKNLLYLPALIIAPAIIYSSCSTNRTLYSWYDYEKISYIYTKKNTEENRGYALEEYKKVIDHQVSLRKTVPPGIYAEYGYMLYKSGRKKEGLKYIKEEAKLYPESEKYISKLIKQLEQ